MSKDGICHNPINRSLSGISIYHALEVLAHETSATTAIFDNTGKLIIGPVPGSDFVRQVLATDRGRNGIIDAHRSAIMKKLSSSNNLEWLQLAVDTFDYYAIPIVKNGQQIATMTLGDRSRQSLTDTLIHQMESAIGVSSDTLKESASRLRPWSPATASAARNMSALLAELLAELCTQDEDLRSRIDELTAVYNISGLLAGTLDLQQILNKTARIVCEVMKVKACSIRMLDKENNELAIKAVHNLSDQYLNKGKVLVGENIIDEAALKGEMVYIADVPTDPRIRYPEQALKEGIVSGLVCGLIYRGDAVGVLRVYTGQAHHFTSFEESLLRAVAAQSAAAIVNAQLVTEAIEAERVTRQLAYAGEVQRRMIPQSAPNLKNAEIGAVYSPTYQVGGDYYDFISLPKGNLGLVIADVSGKGVPASLIMASLRSAMRVNAYHTYDIDHIMAEVNQHMFRDTTLGEFATAFYGVLSPDNKRLTYCNAGHHPPILLRKGNIHYLRTGGMVLGINPQTDFQRELINLESGDILLLYTDGAVDALNFNDESYGTHRLVESLKRYAEETAQHIAKNMLWDIRRFRGLADRTDDVTMVVLKIK